MIKVEFPVYPFGTSLMSFDVSDQISAQKAVDSAANYARLLERQRIMRLIELLAFTDSSDKAKMLLDRIDLLKAIMNENRD